MATDTSEKELEATIEAYLIDEKGERAENSRWLKGESKDFNPEFCVDETMLKAFLQHTQMDKVTRARIYDSPANTRKFLERLRNQITLRGVVDVLRHGMEQRPGLRPPLRIHRRQRADRHRHAQITLTVVC